MNAAEDWLNSYHGRLRTAMGDATLFFLGARGVIRDRQGRFLLIKRTDNGRWMFPAGAMELGESMEACAIRETFEETGLKASRASLFAFLSGPHYTFTNIFGDTYQHVSGSYLLHEPSGELNLDPGEAADGGWFHPDHFPDGTSPAVRWTLDHLRHFEQTGQIYID